MCDRSSSAARVVAGTAVLAVLSSAYACDDPISVETALLQTGHPSYDLEVDAFGDLVGHVDYTFTNETGATVYVVNCQGQFHLWLEQWDGTKWVSAWSAFVPECLSLPIVLEPRQTFEDTVFIWSGCPASDLYPELDCDNPDGIYRIVWEDALSSYQDALPFGRQIPLVYRVSNSFELVKR
jgi:hypothetical protein